MEVDIYTERPNRRPMGSVPAMELNIYTDSKSPFILDKKCLDFISIVEIGVMDYFLF